MEEILASIKRIIADDGAAAAARPRPPLAAPIALVKHTTANRPAPAPAEEVLELTETVRPEAKAAADAPAAPNVAPLPSEAAPSSSAADSEPTPSRAAVSAQPELLSDTAAEASRQAFAALSAMIVKSDPAMDNTLEGLVREMLRPMLKDWLDARLPELVEGVVQREIARIAGRSL